MGLFGNEEKIPLSHALLWILVSTLLVSGTAFMGWLYFLHVKDRRLHDDQYRIVAIIQKSAQKEALKTIYLAQLLDLSIDQPVNLYQFDGREGEKKILASPLIKKAAIKKIRPGTLFIDYQMRTPLAYVENYRNAAIDEEGVLFPFSPFFTPKTLPAIYLDLPVEDYQWGMSLSNRKDLQLALKVMEKLEPLRMENVLVQRIDVSQAFADSFGKRQIVLVLKEKDRDKTVYLRLNPAEYAQNLVNYETFRQYERVHENHEAVQVVDLRIPHLAFIKREGKNG